MKSLHGQLWHNSDFLKLWFGQTISDLGSALSGVALPLVAIMTLHVSSVEMGLLQALNTLPVLLFGMFVGVWVDRVKRRPLMIVAQFGQALVWVVIPGAALLGWLRIEFLYVVTFVAGSLALIFDLAATSLIPSVVGRDNLVEGNARFQLSHSVISIAGPGLAGMLVQLMTAPLVIAFDALSFFISGIWLLRIRTTEAPTVSNAQRTTGVWHEIVEGWHTVFRDPVLAPMTIGTAIASCASAVQGAVFLLFLTQNLQITPTWLGLILASAGIASLLGAVVARPLVQRIGAGLALIGMAFLELLGMALIPLVARLGSFSVSVLIVAQMLISGGLTVFSITQISVRQARTPNHLLGRVNACRRVLVFGIVPIAALLGGFGGKMFGFPATLWVGAIIMLLALLWLWFSPLRHLSSQPAPSPEKAENSARQPIITKLICHLFEPLRDPVLALFGWPMPQLCYARRQEVYLPNLLA